MIIEKAVTGGLIHSSPSTIDFRLPFKGIILRLLDPFYPRACPASKHQESTRLPSTPSIQVSIISWFARSQDSRQCTLSPPVHHSSNSILLQRNKHLALYLFCPTVISPTPSLQVHDFHAWYMVQVWVIISSLLTRITYLWISFLWTILLCTAMDSSAILHTSFELVADYLVDMIWSRKSDIKCSCTGYIIHSPIHSITPSKHESFWKYQATIIHGCRRRHGLCALIFHTNYASPIIFLRHFAKFLCEDGWLFHQVLVYYPAFGEPINSTAHIVRGIHSSAYVTKNHKVITSLVTFLSPFDSYILWDFHKENYILS